MRDEEVNGRSLSVSFELWGEEKKKAVLLLARHSPLLSVRNDLHCCWRSALDNNEILGRCLNCCFSLLIYND
jgi:hypothetical protein